MHVDRCDLEGMLFDEPFSCCDRADPLHRRILHRPIESAAPLPGSEADLWRRRPGVSPPRRLRPEVAGARGERRTGGWAVSIRHLPGGTILVDLRGPRKDQMTTQVISYPFQISLVPVLEMQSLPPMEMTPTWSSKMKTYRVAKGDFEFSGGIRGMVKKFGVEGTIGVLTYEDKVTYNFNLSGKGADNQLKLSETASGALNAGQLSIAQLEPSTFVEMPHPPVKVTGTATEQKLSLIFESLPARIADGFMGRGKLEAVKIK